MYTSGYSGASAVFETLRAEVPLERLLDVNGSGKAHCIAHDDGHASLHVYDDGHAYCFACSWRGDVTDVWALKKEIEKPFDAALDLAKEFGVDLPEISEEGRHKAESARSKEASALTMARRCHKALEGHPAVVSWWEERGFSEDLRQKFLLGANKDGTEATIPFWARGRVVGIIRRKLEGTPKYILPSSEDLPNGHKPLFIPGAIKREMFLAEGFIDGLAVEASGRSAVVVGGTNMSAPQARALGDLLPEGRSIYILPDDDESGAEAARTWGRQFFPAAKICQAHYGDGAHDVADLFQRTGAEGTAGHLDRLAAGSSDVLEMETDAAAQVKGVRDRLAYVLDNIIPLLVKIPGDSFQDSTADIVADHLPGIKKSYLNKAMKEEKARLQAESFDRMVKMAQAEAERQQEEYEAKVAEAQAQIAELLSPGVLERLREASAKVHNVAGDRQPLELALLVALGAQLEPLPNGRPLGASMLLTAQAGRGKNHVVDAACRLLPPSFYFSFEIASGQSLYYAADEDPEFVRHKFCYPNEIEGAEQLWEFLRPMLSKGRCFKIVTAKDPDGNMTTREITVEGPVTLAVPTIRNRTDEQLMTRLLVAELPDFPGRVKQHSRAISEQLLPDAAEKDFSREAFMWAHALLSLTAHRRVIFPLDHRDFAFDDDSVAHGSRLWANVISLLATHAWLEQKNRRKIELASGEVGIEGTPEDYAQAYKIFNAVCKRTVINLSTAHRKILDGVYSLQEDDPGRYGFTQREVATAADVSRSTVSDNKTFLVMSAKLLKEADDGLALVEGADPSWWAEGELMEGLPTPEQVQTWWDHRPDGPDGGSSAARQESAERAEQPSKAPTQDGKPDRNGDSSARHSAEQPPSARRAEENGAERSARARHVLGKVPSSENGIDKGNGDAAEQRARLLGMLGNIQPSSNLHPLLSNRPPWLEEAVETYLEDPDKHFKPFSALVAAEVLGDGARVSEIEEEFAELLRMTSPSEQE